MKTKALQYVTPIPLEILGENTTPAIALPAMHRSRVLLMIMYNLALPWVLGPLQHLQNWQLFLQHPYVQHQLVTNVAHVKRVKIAKTTQGATQGIKGTT